MKGLEVHNNIEFERSRGSRLSVVLTFISIFFIAYAPVWAVYYIKISRPNVQLLATSIKNFEQSKCSIKERLPGPLGLLICKNEYRIPASLLQKNFHASNVLGLGVLVHLITADCGDRKNSEVPLELNMGGQALDAINRYQIVSNGLIFCKSDLVVRAWCPSEYRRCGHIDGPLVSGPADSVERLSKFIEFFRRDLLFLLLALFIAAEFSRIIVSKFSGLQDSENESSKYTIYWVPFLFVVSGASSVLIPVELTNFFWARLSNFLAISAFCGFSFGRISCLLLRKSKGAALIEFLNAPIGRLSLLPRFTVLVAMFCLSDYFAIGFAPIFLVLAVLFMVSGLLFRDLVLTLMAVSALADSLKLLGVPFMPTAYVQVLFSLGLLAEGLRVRLRLAARYFSLVRWTQSYIVRIPETNDITDILFAVMDRLSIGRISILIPDVSGSCRVIQASLGSDQAPRSKSRTIVESVPPVVAHIMTTKSPIWNIEQDSVFAQSLRKGESAREVYTGRYFSALPLKDDSGVFGVFSMTNYSEQYLDNGLNFDGLRTVVDLVTGPLIERLRRAEFGSAKEWSRSVSGIDLSCENSSSYVDYLSAIVARIGNTLGCRVCLFSLDSENRALTLQATFGYSSAGLDQLKNTKIYAVKKNEQGPVALAVNRNRAISVQNVAWISSVLHSSSVNLLDAIDAQSMCVVPVSLPGAHDADSPSGLLWLDSSHVGFFTAAMESEIQQLSKRVGEGIFAWHQSRVNSESIQLLKKMLPEDVAIGGVARNDLQQFDSGFLLMCDLRDSTLLSRRLGAEVWTKFVDSLGSDLKNMALDRGGKLQSVQWDAFYFTFSVPRNQEAFARILSFIQELKGLIEGQYPDEFRAVRDVRSRDLLARFCLVYGDTSMGLSGKVNARWTFTGTAMAEVSKLEQVSKTLTGEIFSVGIQDLTYESNWIALDVSVPGVEQRVFVFRSGAVSGVTLENDKGRRVA